jgi:hypothetical protein
MSDTCRQLYSIGNDLQRLSIWAGTDIVDDLTDAIEKLVVMRTTISMMLRDRTKDMDGV